LHSQNIIAYHSVLENLDCFSSSGKDHRRENLLLDEFWQRHVGQNSTSEAEEKTAVKEFAPESQDKLHKV
jgi:hypothetical protein